MDKMALLSNWGARDNVSIAKIPAGTNIKYAIGTAREQMSAIESRPGGGLQLLEVCAMNKYKILEEKLINLKVCIAQMEVSDEATKRYLTEFDDYVNKLIVASCEGRLRNSHGALLGLTKGISDYDELCANDELWECVLDADNYYAIECNIF